MKKLLLSALAVSVMFVSCDKGDDNPTPTKPVAVAKEKDQKEVFAAIEEIYSGDVAKIKANFPKVKDHLAVDAFHKTTKDAIRADFQSWLDNYETKTATTASNGTAGKLDNRVFNEKGIEYFQLAKKGFIGAYQFSNAMTEISATMKTGANNEEILVNTVAYLIGSYDYLDKGKDEKGNYPEFEGNEFVHYLNKVNKADGFQGIGDEFYQALKKAKANVKADSFPTDILAAFGIAEKIAAIRGVHYLKYYKNLDQNSFNVSAAHEISEGIGFIYSLQFTYNHGAEPKPAPYLSNEEVKNFIDSLNLWDANDASSKLETFGKEVAETFNFDWEKA